MKMKNRKVSLNIAGPRIVEISVDEEMIKLLANRFHTENCMALEDKTHGFGVWFTEYADIGVYGKTPAHRAIIDQYWDNHAEQILKSFYSAKNFDDLMDAAKCVIIGTVLTVNN